jgi:hypothetical protein
VLNAVRDETSTGPRLIRKYFPKETDFQKVPVKSQEGSSISLTIDPKNVWALVLLGKYLGALKTAGCTLIN